MSSARRTEERKRKRMEEKAAKKRGPGGNTYHAGDPDLKLPMTMLEEQRRRNGEQILGSEGGIVLQGEHIPKLMNCSPDDAPEVCHKYNVQNCHNCSDLECCDNFKNKKTQSG